MCCVSGIGGVSWCAVTLHYVVGVVGTSWGTTALCCTTGMSGASWSTGILCCAVCQGFFAGASKESPEPQYEKQPQSKAPKRWMRDR